MEDPIPDILIFKDSRLSIEFVKDNSENRTDQEIAMYGNRNGFLSLANIMLFFFNGNDDDLQIDSLPFVTTKDNLKLTLRSLYYETVPLNGKVKRVADDTYV